MENTSKKVRRVKCPCPCHQHEGIKHVIACCDDGYIDELPPVPKKVTVYIAGKIGNLPEEVYMRNFNEAKALLASQGYKAFTPFDTPHNHDKSWAAYMMECLEKLLIPCDAIAMLPNWYDSPGAQIEHAFAFRMRKKIIYLPVIP